MGVKLDMSLRFRVSSLVGFAVGAPLAVAVFAGMKEYQVWSQVLYLWELGASPLEQLTHLSPHALRYALIYPILILAERMELGRDYVFSVAMLLICFVTFRNIIFSVEVLSSRKRNWVMVSGILTAATVLVFFFMNGRIGIAFLGYSLLLRNIILVHYLRRFSILLPFNILLALFLCSVSSGTLVSAIVALLIAAAAELVRSFSRRRLSWPILAIVVATGFSGAILADFVLVGILKNIAFYGGGYDGFLAMLSHGFGARLLPILSLASFPVLLGAAIGTATLGSVMLSRLPHPLLLHLFLAAVACGAFGYSTLSIAFLPFMVLVGLGGSRSRLIA